MQETVLITGGAGYIGSHIGFLLARKGYRVILLDALHYHHKTPLFPWGKLTIGDYGNREILNTIFTAHRIKAVIHCAGYNEINNSMIDPHTFYENNVVKTITLLDCMRTHNVPCIIFSSNCAVYGNPENTPIAETHLRNPISPYGNTKHMIEMILKDYNTAYGINYVALRIFNAAGAVPEYQLGEPRTPATHLIPLLINAALTGKPFSIFGTSHDTHDGTSVRDYVHVLDIADAQARALNHLLNGNASDCFNIGTGRGTSVRAMINAVEQIYNLKIKIHHAVPHQGDPAILIADASRARDILGWNPRYSALEFIIRSTYTALIRNQRNKENRALQ